MKRISLLTLLFAVGCGGMRARPDPGLPRIMTQARGAELYEAHKLVCSDGECQQGDGVFPVKAYARTRLRAPRRVFAHHRRVRKGTAWIFWGLTIASAVGAGAAAMYASDNNDDFYTVSAGLGGGAGVLLTTGLLVNFLWPEVDSESFEEAYNAQLAADIERRVAPELVTDKRAY